MIGREMLQEEGVERLGARRAGLAFCVVGPGLVVEVARAGDPGVLQRVRPGADLARAGLGGGYEI